MIGDVRDVVDLLRFEEWDGLDDGSFLRTLALKPVSGYSDWSDIEEEMNGLLTYDRRVNKMLE